MVGIEGIEVTSVGGLPTVVVDDWQDETVMQALETLVAMVGADAVVDGDHRTVAFDPERITEATLRNALDDLS
ncbi:hypothetical protein BDK89_0114 [Ilumatobacter fluminis]|uniref:Copper chaperone CopZ n=1 Tax=Ilumatobacter fluminis TaxID=467091 RepID=A0A4R7HVL0_9ACTN|nr:hypothetical protein BDK89_0114 [Ilumatobacter fluminis]